MIVELSYQPEGDAFPTPKVEKYRFELSQAMIDGLVAILSPYEEGEESSPLPWISKKDFDRLSEPERAVEKARRDILNRFYR